MIPNLSIPLLQHLAGIIRECFPRAATAIAGGAVRDTLNKRPVKDIDVFIYLDQIKKMRPATASDPDSSGFALYPGWAIAWRDDSELMADYQFGCEKLGKYLHSPWFSNENDGPMEELSKSKGYGPGAFSLVNFPGGFRGHEVQLVFIDIDPVENISDHFDFGLSKAWVTPNRLHLHPDYQRDYFSKTIRYTGSTAPNDQRLKSSALRARRLREKYADWRFEGLWKLPPLLEIDGKVADGPAKPKLNKHGLTYTPTYRGKAGL